MPCGETPFLVNDHQNVHQIEIEVAYAALASREPTNQLNRYHAKRGIQSPENT
jgi:hypothetical protein